MAIKELARRTNEPSKEKEVEKFISQGGTLPTKPTSKTEDHRLTLRIPSWLMDKVDEKRKQRVGKISRNLFILEAIEKATRE